MIGARTFMLFAIAVMAPALAGSQSAQALCFGTSCRNAVWQQGAQGTSFGGISRGARLTPYGVTSGQQTSFGVVGAQCRKTPWGYYCSDIRLKRDVAPVARLDDGLTLYRYRYLWSDEVYVGVMAQEVAAIDPAAVTSGSDGYLRVNYARLGLRLETWREWSTAH